MSFDHLKITKINVQNTLYLFLYYSLLFNHNLKNCTYFLLFQDGQDIFEIRESFDIFSLEDDAKIPESLDREDDLKIYQTLGAEAIQLTSRYINLLVGFILPC